MAASLTLLQGASSQGYRASRMGDLVVITMQGAAFATTAQEHTQAQHWARGRSSTGNVQRDRTAYCDRHETLLARNGCGLATKGHRPVLARLVKAMQECGMQLNEWAVPHNINESVEIVKKKAAAEPGAEGT